MIKAINPFGITEYISWTERHLPEEEQTVFLIQYPDLKESGVIEDAAINSQVTGKRVVTKLTSGAQRAQALRTCVKGWKNFLDWKGNKIPFVEKPADKLERSLSYIPPHISKELANELIGNRQNNQDLIDAAKEKGVPVE